MSVITKPRIQYCCLIRSMKLTEPIKLLNMKQNIFVGTMFSRNIVSSYKKCILSMDPLDPQLYFANSTRRFHSKSSSSSSSSSSKNGFGEERPRRSLFSCPGAEERKINKAKTLGADAVVLDLEDGVAMHKKNSARELVVTTLQEAATALEESIPLFGKSEICVRINALDTQNMAFKDLQAILPCRALDAIVIPKVESPDEIMFVNRLIEMTPECYGRDIRLIAAIESARGMLNLKSIAATAIVPFAGHYIDHNPTRGRLDALVFASEDYCADLETVRTREATELLYARSQIVLTAKAYGVQAIDMVHIQYKDIDGLEVECQRGKELGFTGKQAIHPIQIPTIHKIFAPSPEEFDFAKRIVKGYSETISSGGGACIIDGIVVDAPVFKWAKKILKRAESANSNRNSS